eukprot:GHRQ01024103.1.p1 GENE.GHRQ01024103.1~~GHRQ01024103.1.p1  ORF type:complete len:287 (+),score=92.86 GHRQ01024103.1:2155-3015(+)
MRRQIYAQWTMPEMTNFLAVRGSILCCSLRAVPADIACRCCSDVLEWTWFLNSFSDKHIYDFMYGDKDTYGVAFGMAGKAHMYQHINVPPGGVFTNLAHLGWNPRAGQMKKQGNWWLQGLVHYDHQGEVLLLHRVTGEVHVPAGHAPRDEIITPPIPHSWSMWFMGYGPEANLLRSIDVVNYNITYFMGTALPNQACPLAAWNAYWTMRTHGIPTVRNTTLEKHCASMLDAEYGPTAANMIRNAGLMEHPTRLAINADWDNKVDGKRTCSSCSSYSWCCVHGSCEC